MPETAEYQVECLPFRARLSLKGCRANQKGRKNDLWYPCGTCEAGKRVRELLPEAPPPREKGNWATTRWTPKPARAATPQASAPDPEKISPRVVKSRVRPKEESMTERKVLPINEAFCRKHPEERQLVVKDGRRKGVLLGRCRLCMEEIAAKRVYKKKEASAARGPRLQTEISKLPPQKATAAAQGDLFADLQTILGRLARFKADMEALGIEVKIGLSLGGGVGLPLEGPGASPRLLAPDPPAAPHILESKLPKTDLAKPVFRRPKGWENMSRRVRKAYMEAK
jgi:hypothetical protein